MRDRLTGERYTATGGCENWYPGGEGTAAAISDGTDPLTLALLQLQAIEGVCRDLDASRYLQPGREGEWSRLIVRRIRKALLEVTT